MNIHNNIKFFCFLIRCFGLLKFYNPKIYLKLKNQIKEISRYKHNKCLFILNKHKNNMILKIFLIKFYLKKEFSLLGLQE